MSTGKRRMAVSLGVVALVAAMAVASFTAGAGAQSSATSALPRGSTLYTSGTAWGPFASFNPLRIEKATGVLGLLYETLFRYDPLKDQFIPWLSTSGKWAGSSYVVTLRKAGKWNDAKPFARS